MEKNVRKFQIHNLLIGEKYFESLLGNKAYNCINWCKL